MRANTPHSERLSAESELKGALRTLARGAVGSFVGRLAGTALRYFSFVGLARLFGVEAFGIYALGLGVYQLLELVASLGLVQGIVRHASIFRSRGEWEGVRGVLRAARELTVGAGVLLGLGLFLGATPLAAAFQQPSLGEVFRLFALALPFGAAAWVLASATTAFETTRYLILVRELLLPGVVLLALGVLAIAGGDFQNVIVAWPVATLGAFLLAHRFLHDLLRPYPARFAPHPRWALLRSCWPLWLAGFSGFALLWTDTFALGYFRSVGEVGIYRAAAQTALLLSLPLTALNTIFSPMIAALHHGGEHERLARLFKTAARWSLALTLPGFLLVALYGKDLLSLFGAEFAAGHVPLLLLAGAQLVNAGTGSVGFALIMSGRTVPYLLGDLALVGMNVVFNVLLIPIWGAVGAAWATSLSIVGVNLLRMILVWRYLGFHPFERAHWGIGIAGGLSFLSGWGLLAWMDPSSVLSLVLTATAMFSVYLAVLSVFGLTAEDRGMLRGLGRGQR